MLGVLGKKNWVAFACCCVGVLACCCMRAHYVLAIEPLPEATLNLTSPAYDIVELSAPAADGMLLRALARVLSNGLLGPLICRMLLNDNQIWRLRELSLQVPEHIVHRPLPMQRLSRSQHALHAKLAAEASDEAGVRTAAAPRRQPPARWGARDYHASYATGATTPVEVVKVLLEAVPRVEARVGAVFTEIRAAEVLAQAVASRARWESDAPLSVWDGVPIAVKEMIDVEGHVTGFGSHRGTVGAPSRPPAESDDPMVAKMRAAGAIVLGQTAMTEWGVTPLGWSAHAQGPRNPHALDRYPGGSSSGAAVAVATGLVPMAIGFDGGGSIRIPAALSGVQGLAAGFGRVPFRTDGASSMTHGGPLAATVADAASSYLLMAKSRPADEEHTSSRAYGPDGAPPPHVGGWEECADLAGVRLGVFREHFDDATDEVRAAAGAALDALERRGAVAVPISIPNLRALSLAHGLAIASEFAWAHDREATSGWPLEPSTAVQLMLGRAVTAVELLAAHRLRSWAMAYVSDLFESERLDAIVTPTVGRTAPPLSAGAVASGASDTALVVSLMKHIFLANLLGLPALSSPIGAGRLTGLPVGLQLIGGWWEEARLLRLACALEHEYAGDASARPAVFARELDELLTVR